MEKQNLLEIWLSRTRRQNTILDKTRNVQIHFLGKMLRGIVFVFGVKVQGKA